MEDAAQQNRPAEKAMIASLSSAQMRLVADWLREEVSLFEQTYAQAGKRVRFLAERLDAVSTNASSDDGSSDNDNKLDKNWRFSDEYWEKYEAEDD